MLRAQHPESFHAPLSSGTPAFSKVVDLFRPYLEKSGHAQELAAMLDGDGLPLFSFPALNSTVNGRSLPRY